MFFSAEQADLILPQIETYRTTLETLRISPDIVGFSARAFPADRTQLPLAAFTRTGPLGRIAICYRPTKTSETGHPPQDSSGNVTRPDSETIGIFDGVSAFFDSPHPQSQYYSSHLAANLAPIDSAAAAQAWLTSLAPVEDFDGKRNMVTPGGSGIKVATIIKNDSEYTLHLTQLGNRDRGLLLGATIVVDNQGEVRHLPISRDTTIYMGSNSNYLVADYQRHTITPGSLVILASDGFDTDNLARMLLPRYRHNEITRLSRKLAQTPPPTLDQLALAVSSLTPNNPDDATLGLVWLS